MLKGHVFKNQIFGNQIFALFINTFLNGKNGVSNSYKNGMGVTYSGSTVTVNSGAVCIQGRFLEEDTSTDISAGTDNAYCKLVVEVDLDKQNTASEFLQGVYKVVKSTSAYPNLTQTDIAKNNSGIYQYELARFRTSASGITDFQDMRTFLDFDSIYTAIQTEYRQILAQLKQELANVEDGSAYVLKNDTVAIHGKILDIEASSSKNVTIPFLSDFTINNTAIISCGLFTDNGKGYNFIGTYADSGDGLNNAFRRRVNVTSDGIKITVFNPNTELLTVNYKIIIMKIPSYAVTKGDVDLDGTIDNIDLQMIKDYIMGDVTLTEKQFQSADMNSDGKVTASDYVSLQNELGGV